MNTLLLESSKKETALVLNNEYKVVEINEKFVILLDDSLQWTYLIPIHTSNPPLLMQSGDAYYVPTLTKNELVFKVLN